ncbi:MAG: peptidoglycan DD-metalloendopeptidase family protein [Candidatus Omnitrophota bacterium]
MIVFLTGCVSVYYPETAPISKERGKGVFHPVKKGQTLWRIAQSYNVDIDQVIALNNISDASLLRPGEKIFIPGADHVLDIVISEDHSPKDGFSWPLKGPVLSHFSSSRGLLKQGIRIKAGSRSPITAVRQGEVVFADDLLGYGSTVIIDHHDGLMSVYANNGQFSIALGDEVRQGQAIATSRSGEDSFLYFEIRRNGTAMNPLFYLPKF